MDDKKNLLQDDDYQYELEKIEKERLEKEKEEEEEILRAQKEKEEKLDYQKQLQIERLELMKLKQGLIEESDIIKEERVTYTPPSGMEAVKNFWYHNKWIVIFAAFVVLVIGFITFDTVSREQPDLTILVLCDNGIDVRREELQEFFEYYCEDLNDDGDVYVKIYNIPLSQDSDPSLSTSNQSKFLAELQRGENLLILADPSSTPFNDIFADLKKDFDEDKSEYFSEYGLKFDFEILKEKLLWEDMPSDMYLGIRSPDGTLITSKEDMQEYYDIALELLKNIVSDLCK